ncbi:MAG: hypothetical protein E7Z86_05570 [Methanosphaera stadtmanae]|nr:hypothetical protein [Methanosphaera stadtmanae]
MIKIEKVLLFAIVLVFLVGVASATETPQEDQSYTNDDTVVSDISTVSQDNKIINNEEKKVLDENPQKNVEYTTHNIEKKSDNNLKKEGIVEVHNYTELQNAVNNASSKGVDTTIRLLQGSYNNTGTIRWDTGGMVLTIDGNGQTINGHQQQVFYIIDASMILKNITITNAFSDRGGAIFNYKGTLTVSNSTFNNNLALSGGAIYNNVGKLTVTHSTFTNNQAFGGIGGAIYDTVNILTNITSCNFINNTASNGAAIYAGIGEINLTNNTFKQNTATNHKETIDLNSWWNGKHEDNIYESTDIALNEIKLTIKDDQKTFQQDEDIILNYTIQLTNPMHYWDFETGINDITLYINGEKNKTTQYENTTIKDLPAGKYEIYYTTCNQKSNTVTFKVIGDSQITTPEESYEYYSGVNNKIPLIITDPSGEKGTINITVKNDDEYKQLFTYYNIGDGYELPTESLASALENLYNSLSDSYTINIIYSSDCANPSSTEFTLNINKQRNTTIVYDILNNTEGNVQINITVQDAVYKTPIADATIQITGDINTDTTSGILTDNTLTPGDYTINVKYPETEDYKASQTTIDFTVEIDKDKKIAELEGQVENLTEKLEQANEKIENLTNQLEQAKEEIETLNNTISNLTTQLEDAENKISTLNNTIENITQQLEQAQEEIETLNNTISNLTTQLEDAENKISTLNNTIENITQQLEQAQEEIETLNNTNNNLTRQLIEANQKIDSLNNQISNLTQKIKEKDNQIENLTEQITDLTKQLQDAQKEIQTLTQENNNLNNQLKQTQEEIENLTTQLNDTTQQLETAKDQINNLTQQLDETQQTIETLNNTIKELTKPPLNTTITINPIKSSIGSITKITANIQDENGEKVTGGKAIFKINGITLKDENSNTIYAQVKDGIASINYKVQNTWIKNTTYIEAVYSGTENYTSSRTKQNGILNITKGKATITLDPTATTAKAGQTITLRAKVLDANGDRINNDKVIFKLNGITLKDQKGNTLYAQVIDGEAILNYTIPATYSAKTYTLTAVIGGNYYQRTETNGTVTLEKKIVTINPTAITTKNNKTAIKATITDESNKQLIKSTPLAIKVNGITMLSGTNSTNGTINVSFNNTLKSGLYELLIISGETGLYKSGKTTTILKI